MFIEAWFVRQLISLFYAWPYLDAVIPLFVIVYTNVLLIILSVMITTVGKLKTQMFIYQDDDERFIGDNTSPHSFYLYVVRLYLFNCLQLEIGPNIMENELEDKLDLDDPLLERDLVLIIELLNHKGQHATKLQLDMDLMRRCYKSKFSCQSGMLLKPYRLSLTRENKKLINLYLVKFCFQRHEPLKGISQLRIRQLEQLPLHLYQVEIQDTGQENVGLICHVNSAIGMNSQNFKCLLSCTYTSVPLDTTFNTHKLIWVEMMLIFLFGLNIQSLISITLIDYYEQSNGVGEQRVWRVFWVQCLFGSLLPALVTLAVVLFYRIFTNHFPHTRKSVRHYLSLLMHLMIVIISIISICHALNHELIFSLDGVWGKWVAGYLCSVLIYLALCAIIITLDLCFLHKL